MIRLALVLLLALSLGGCGPWFFYCLESNSKAWICKV